MEANTSLTQKLTYPKRPAQLANLRSKDQPVNLIANLMKLQLNSKNIVVHQYSIKVLPEIAQDNYPKLKKIQHSLSRELSKQFGRYIISGYSLFTCKADCSSSVKIATKFEETDYQIVIEQSKNTIDLTNCKGTDPDCIQIKSFIETLIKQIISSNNQLVRFDKGDFFDIQNTKRNERQNGVIMPGFNTAVTITDSGLTFRVNTKNKNLSDKTAYDVMIEKGKKFKGSSLMSELKEFFVGRSLLARYGAHRVYKIDDVSEKTVSTTTINVKTADNITKTISLVEYYKNQYQLTIKDVNQILLVHKKKGAIQVVYLIPELMYLTGLDEEDDSEQQRGNQKRSRPNHLNPSEKMRMINDIQRLLNNTEKKVNLKNPQALMKSPQELKEEWGLQINDYCKFTARVLPPPQLNFNRGESVTCIKNGFSYRKLVNSNGGFPSQSWICITAQRSIDNAKTIIMKLRDIGKRTDVFFDLPEIKAFNSRDLNSFMEEIKTIKFRPEIKIVFIVLNKYIKNYYPSIKQYLNTQAGIPSQCVLEENKSKPDSYFTNVVNQMVVKSGGELYHITLHQFLNQNPTMILGVDCARAKGNKRRYTMTFTYNQFYSRFYSEEKECARGEEEITLQLMLSNAFNFFLKCAPNLVFLFVYRTGGNDRQNDEILRREVPIFKTFVSGKGKGAFREGMTVKMLYLVVNKKNNLKFFKTNPQDGRDLANPDKGTVIDSHVLTPEKYEFYLQPQFVNQGTATPVHFLVLYDEIHMPIEELESITYKQTYYYWNWNGPVREPAALKYAEVCGAYNSKVLKNMPIHEKLKNTPYFI